MKSNSKTLGDILQLVEDRNRDEVTTEVLGISINKEFMPSVANVIGTDLSKYKLLSRGCFACNSMHTGRDERLPIALYKSDEPAIVSPAYFMFGLKDDAPVDEDYLMMWFQRPEFDRLCWFMTDASVRGGLSWDDLCRIEINLPSIEDQRKIVHDYKVVTDRIELLKKINENLEAQALAVFTEKCIKSDDAQSWNEGVFGDMILGTISGDWGSAERVKNKFFQVICFRGADMPNLNIGITNEAPIRFILQKNYETKKLSPDNFIIEISGGSPTQSTGRISLVHKIVIDKCNDAVICSNFCKGVSVEPSYIYYFYWYWKYLYNNKKMFDFENGTTGLKNFDFDTFVSMEKIRIPSNQFAEHFNKIMEPIYLTVIRNGFELERLIELKDTVLPHIMNGGVDYAV